MVLRLSFFFFSSRRRHTRSVSAFLLNRSSDLTTLPTAYDVYPLDGRHDGGYYTVNSHTVLDGIITTIMATIQRINIIGSREGSRNRRRLKANQKIGRASCRERVKIINETGRIQ